MMFKTFAMISALLDRSLILEFTSGSCIFKTRHRFNWPLPHSKEKWHRVEVRVVKNNARKGLYLDFVFFVLK